ncbi:MAG: DUF1840 domain-containing protein [Rubrivivax sp.]|nr:DUF1840 domain-containing protein [Rubrivivax sp.]
MLYRFRSAATGDVVMLGANGDELLRLLGREPSAQGIVEAAALPDAIARLQAAVASAESPAETPADDQAESKPASVGLRQRVWPVVEMFRRAQAAGEPVVWGV